MSVPAGGSAPVIPPPVVESRQLANGLSVLVQPDFTAPVVSIQFWCGTGSIHEGAWLGAGMSHLLEHLMFKGTPTRGNSRMAQEIQDLGGHLNAYTSFDRTVEPFHDFMLKHTRTKDINLFMELGKIEVKKAAEKPARHPNKTTNSHVA